MEQQPNDFKVHNAAATLLGAEGDMKGAIDEAQKAITLAPQEYQPYMTLAFLQIRSGQPDAAGQDLKKAAELAPTLLKPSWLWPASINLASNSGIGTTTQAGNCRKPQDSELRAALVKLYAGQGKKPKPNKSRKRQARYGRHLRRYRMPGDYYFAIGDIDRATTEYTALYHDHPQDMQVKKNYIQLLILKNQLDDAGKLMTKS